MSDPYRPGAPAPYWQPIPPRRGIPLWTWIAVGGTLLLVGVVAVLLPDTSGGHTAGASPATRAARASASKKNAQPAWPPPPVAVTRKQLGAGWPFKLTSRGLVACVKEHPGAVIFNPGDGPELGQPFALNGTALDAGYRDVPKRIWSLDPVVGGGARKSVSPVQDRAPNRCQR